MDLTPSSTQQFGDRKVCWNSCRISLNISKSMAFMNVVISIVLTYYCRFLKSHSFECSFIKITSSTPPLLFWSACFRPEGERTCIYIYSRCIDVTMILRLGFGTVPIVTFLYFSSYSSEILQLWCNILIGRVYISFNNEKMVESSHNTLISASWQVRKWAFTFAKLYVFSNFFYHMTSFQF